jgi:predicted Zn-ribbon and HTH transcriptional regulator
MSAEKPSKNEDEYFAREEAERLKQLRAHETADRTAAERLSHHMRCPKCGGRLQTEAFHGVQVDRCPDCHGIWFDNNEVESLMKDEDHGVLRKVMGDIRASLRKLRAGA